VNTSDMGTQGAAILAAAEALVPLVREYADQIEAERRIPPQVIAAMRAAGIFRMTAPRDWGGPELDPMMQFRILETISAADGSTGWCAYTGATSGYFACYLDPLVSRGMFADVDAATAGNPMPGGRAEVIEGGYRITGRWGFGSGVNHAAWVVGGCGVYENGVPLLEGGIPKSIVAFLAADQIRVLENWNATGLRGTGSHDYEVSQAFVPQERTFNLFSSPIRQGGALYALRTMIFFNHTGVVVGIARGALEAFKEFALSKGTPWGRLSEQEYAQSALAHAEALVSSARSYCLETMTDAYRTLAAGEALSLRQRALYRLSITHAHRAAVEAVDVMFNAAGASAVRMPGRLERSFRDAHTANQHMVASPKSYAITGLMLLGEQSKDPLY
jgi:indole-3-acetate monooxygenase